MRTKTNYLQTAKAFMILSIFLIFIISCGQVTDKNSTQSNAEKNSSIDNATYDLFSPGKVYGAKKIGTGNNKHYQIIEIKTGNIILTTCGQYCDTPNDVKRGKFSPDSKKFAALYNYNGYAWIGIWDLETKEQSEKIIKNTVQDQYLTTIDNSVFQEN